MDIIELAIGYDSNQKSAFKQNGIILKEEQTPNVLNCDEFLEFWVAKTEMTIDFGFGRVRQSMEAIRLTWRKEFQAVSFASADGVAADWEIHKDSGRSMFEV